MNSEDIKEDFLEVDQKIPGQNYVCLSFVSPEKVLKNKEVFFATKFLECLFNDNEQGTVDVREKMMNKEIKFNYDEVSKIYDDWKYTRTEDLESLFFEKNDYHTSMRGIKVRGVYDTYKEATIRAQILRRKDPSFNVFVGQVGYWLPWDPECESVPEQEFQENQLNELVKKYKENLSNRDTLFDQIKNERIEKANKEVAARKEILKAQNEMKVPDDNTEVDSKNIEQLRSIVDESDRLFYENMKKNGGKVAEDEKETDKNEVVTTTQEEVVLVEKEETETTNAPEKNNYINNFKSESMENLESEDPWLNRKKKD
jgi:hypothetical protein